MFCSSCFPSGGTNAEDDFVIGGNNQWKGKSSKLVCKYVYFNLFSNQSDCRTSLFNLGSDEVLIILYLFFFFYIHSKGLDHPNLHSRPAWVYHLLDHGLQKWWRIIYQFKVQIKDTNIIFVLWPVWIHNMPKNVQMQRQAQN